MLLLGANAIRPASFDRGRLTWPEALAASLVNDSN